MKLLPGREEGRRSGVSASSTRMAGTYPAKRNCHAFDDNAGPGRPESSVLAREREGIPVTAKQMQRTCSFLRKALEH
ncbi:MAG: hypothetical protein QGF00_37450, partial [Planctomycetota bacterium]|nr:hypothetical protein [Planctomycetota bacterium]